MIAAPKILLGFGEAISTALIFHRRWSYLYNSPHQSSVTRPSIFHFLMYALQHHPIDQSKDHSTLLSNAVRGLSLPLISSIERLIHHALTKLDRICFSASMSAFHFCSQCCYAVLELSSASTSSLFLVWLLEIPFSYVILSFGSSLRLILNRYLTAGRSHYQ